MNDGLPGMGAALLAGLRPRRRPPWSEAPVISLSAQGARWDVARMEAFAAVCGGVVPPRVPLTFPYAWVTPLHVGIVTHADFPFAPLGLVHRSERIQRFAVPQVDAPVDVRVRAGAYRQTPGGVAFDLVSEVRQDGALVWRSTTTALKRTSGGASRTYAGDAPRQGDEAVWEVPADTGRRYGRVARNLDPIHVSALTARPFGFRRAIVHGMWTTARCVVQLGEPEGPATLWVRFRSPLSLPGRVRFVGQEAASGHRFAVWPLQGDRPILEGRLDPRADLDPTALD